MAPHTHDHPDELLDEFIAALSMLGRMLHRQQLFTECTHLDVTRLLVMRGIADSEACRVGDIAQLVGIKAPAASALVDGLEREGLVEREHSSEDKRVVFVRLTDAGCLTLATAEEESRRIMRERLAVLSDEEIRTLIVVQRKFIEAMAADSQQ